MTNCVYSINSADKELAKIKYKLTKQQLVEAEKLYHKSSHSWLACCKLVKEKDK